MRGAKFRGKLNSKALSSLPFRVKTMAANSNELARGCCTVIILQDTTVSLEI